MSSALPMSSGSIQFPEHITRLRAYVPGRPADAIASDHALDPQRVLMLASNENALGPSPAAMAALAAHPPDVSRYPDHDCTALVAELSRWHEVPPDWIVTGAGSESVIATAAATLLCPGRRTVFSQYSFQAYANAVQRIGATAVVVPSPQFTVDLHGLHAALREPAAIVYIANPGNPTGTQIAPDELDAFLMSVPPEVVVILDEAYLEYVDPHQRGDAMAWVRRHPNLLVTRTFSKAYGLAGLRIGYGIAQPLLAGMLRRVRSPFTVTDAAQVAARAALHDASFIERTVRNNAESKAVLAAGLERLGMPYVPSQTNFLLARTGDGDAWAGLLEQQGVLVRPLGGYGLREWLRIGVGTPEDSARVIAAMAREITAGRAPSLS
jgi:histidinol-phosphate aminotransferase